MRPSEDVPSMCRQHWLLAVTVTIERRSRDDNYDTHAHTHIEYELFHNMMLTKHYILYLRHKAYSLHTFVSLYTNSSWYPRT